MRHYVYLKKQKNLLKSIKLYGSIKALLDLENIKINGKKPSYNTMMYLLRASHEYENKNFIIKRCDVIKSKRKKVIQK